MSREQTLKPTLMWNEAGSGARQCLKPVVRIPTPKELSLGSEKLVPHQHFAGLEQ